MRIPLVFTITPAILALLSEIDSLRLYSQKIDLQKNISFSITRNSLLKSSLYSARIEGNSLSELTMNQNSSDTETLEIMNIMRALEYIDSEKLSEISHTTIKKLHALVGVNIFQSKGVYRKEASAIFNAAGTVVYMPPPASQVIPQMEKLIHYVQGENDFPLITAFIAHLLFEKIHPFLDGNGRVGRSLIFAILKTKKYEVSFPVTIEEYLDLHRDEYYDALLLGTTHIEVYLTFMLTAYLRQMKVSLERLELILQKPQKLQELTARQEEIYHIIQEQGAVSLNFISRRFIKVPERTLRNDLAKLLKKKLIIKIGSTKGVQYRVREND